MKGIVIVARTRTGTNWLRELLGTCTNGQNLGEVLRPDERHDGNFFAWFESVHGAMPSYRSQSWVADVLSGYIDCAEAHFPVPIFDLKYSSFAAFEPTWRSPIDLPVVLQLLLDRGYRVIHQRRESLLDTAISEAVAAITGVYTSHSVSHARQLKLDAADIVRLGLEYRKELGFVSRLLPQSDQVIDLAYEKLLLAHQSGNLANLLRDLVADTDLEFVGLREVGIKRLLPEWRTIVSNWRDIEAAAHEAGLA